MLERRSSVPLDLRSARPTKNKVEGKRRERHVEEREGGSTVRMKSAFARRNMYLDIHFPVETSDKWSAHPRPNDIITITYNTWGGGGGDQNGNETIYVLSEFFFKTKKDKKTKNKSKMKTKTEL